MTTSESRELNGLPPDKLKEVLKSIEQPDVLKAVSGPWRSRIRWQNGFNGKAYMRNHVVEMDEPSDLTATDVAASAHEMLLAAVGNCMMVGFVLNATKQGIKIHDLEIAVEGSFDNILKWAGLSDVGNPGYGSIHAKVFVKADADEKALRDIWKLAVEGSPVSQTVVHATEITTDFEAL